MILNGKEMRVLDGAITIYVDVPFHQIKKRKLSNNEFKKLKKISSNVLDVCLTEYDKIDDPADSEETKITKRLAITKEWNFTTPEKNLFLEALDYYIKLAELSSDEDKNDLNTYFNGYQYRLDYHDFIELLNRFRDE